ncbi:RNA 2',3'-cyclic phosphodiesterase [Pusillimonas sp.]|uniref:RNA 2',3'-cyclic phosphodiesterase n=1 Tax=Pusillimonas sp. TaxID=3040095 RepID=UPI0037C77D4A
MNTPVSPERTGRLFFALWPDDDTARLIAQRQAALDGGRQTHPRDFHLTLLFLGMQPSEHLTDLKKVVEEITFNPILLTLDRYGEFSRQKVVWAGTGETPQALLELRQRLLSMPALAELPFRREAGFVPHVTLARKTQAPQQVFEPIAWRATRIGLADSTGNTGGPRYRLLACRDV